MGYNNHPNSLCAFDRMVREKTLNLRESQAVEGLLVGGPMTRNELNAACRRLFKLPIQWDKRLAGLEHAGVAKRIALKPKADGRPRYASRICSETGHMNDIWLLSGKAAKKNRKSKKRKTLKWLELMQVYRAAKKACGAARYAKKLNPLRKTIERIEARVAPKPKASKAYSRNRPKKRSTKKRANR